MAGDDMPSGGRDVVFGWVPNTAGIEMARLLYSVNGTIEGVRVYERMLSKYRRELEAGKAALKWQA